MSLDRSLKSSGGGLARHRNVLSRDERVAKLTERGKFDPAAGSPLGLPKVGNRKIAPAAKPKKEAAADGAAAPAAGKAPAAKAAAAPAAKGAAKGK